MFFKKKQQINYLALVPVRKINDFTDADRKVTLVVPKFKNERFRNWFIPKHKSTHIKIHLDEMGSQVWRSINGQRTVEDLCFLLKDYSQNHNLPDTQIEERVTKFLTDLYKNGFISFNEAQLQSGE
jgi:hypothetical protein